MAREVSSHARIGGRPSRAIRPATSQPGDQPPSGARDEDRLAILERALCPSGEMVLGLYVYSAGMNLLRGLSRDSCYRAIVPHLIGTPAMVLARPGLSQTDLARHLGVERATVGKQVAACLRHGWIRREVSPYDKRRFSLYITPKGERMMRDVSRIIPQHEREYTAQLTEDERKTLKRLLRKLITT